MVWTVVVAAGSGRRFVAAKQHAPLAGRTVLGWSVATAAGAGAGVVVVVPPGEEDGPRPAGADAVVAGGATRSESVRRGLAAVPGDATVVLVHDAARPAASPELFAAVVDAVAAGAEVAVPAVAVTDSLRHRDGGALDRDRIVAVQTPQGFRAEVLRRAHATGGEASDDAGLAEAVGARVQIVEGESTNCKITHPEDLAVVAGHLADRAAASSEVG